MSAAQATLERPKPKSAKKEKEKKDKKEKEQRRREKQARKESKGKKAKQGKPDKGKKAKKPRLSAKTADRYDLYQRSVNSPETDVDFAQRVFQELRGRKIEHLREDFCGTAALAAEFLRRDEAHTAEGFDLDPEPIAWGQERNFGAVPDGLARMSFHLKDVRSPSDRRPDITLAQNFSYFIFKERRELLSYFKAVHADLAADGLFQMDIYGGPDSMTEQEEEREIEDGKFTYVWDQQQYWPGTGDYRCQIHFRFKDGSELTGAFTYDWRLWSLPELKDLLLEAGFQQVRTYFEGTDPEDETAGNGEFEFDEKGENCLAWIGYLVSLK